ncbi:hypothetical protein P1X14_18925 [Sphingomonas sp. AOB5]|uniref:hypothetical protein n=1 Tax=Sphingomonas sp. AOB5 TaxID=3034017 RepID=UPI0023F7D6AA|nr:hypothetical protein [Sphingomonas sp. AOB5]MDF7777339.1 hypothetical protein [Sphingomonas sp. AOB5]
MNGDLRPAPASLTPLVCDRLVALANALAGDRAALPSREPTGAYPYRGHASAAALTVEQKA